LFMMSTRGIELSNLTNPSVGAQDNMNNLFVDLA